ncbi:AAA family ATPase [Bradyrhizobium ottawaense]
MVDISGVDDPFTELERLAGVCPPDVRVAVIGDNREITFYRELLELGLTEYLPRPLTRDLVLDKLRPKLFGDVAANQIDRGGHVVSICGAQGGAGATSIAINLALQLAETTKAKVALLDLHLQGGEAAVMLGVRPGPGLRIALENPTRADTLFLERAAIEVNERVCLVSAGLVSLRRERTHSSSSARQSKSTKGFAWSRPTRTSMRSLKLRRLAYDTCLVCCVNGSTTLSSMYPSHFRRRSIP